MSHKSKRIQVNQIINRAIEVLASIAGTGDLRIALARLIARHGQGGGHGADAQ